MLTDRYGLPLSTTVPAARDAYVEGVDLLLTVYPGAASSFDRAIAADPGFALAHIGKARAFQLAGNLAAMRESLATAQSLSDRVSAREQSHIDVFRHLFAGQAVAALAAIRVHVDAWPRDALVLSLAANQGGLIGMSGLPGREQGLVDFLDPLAPQYGEDWWFEAHYGMALSEIGQHDSGIAFLRDWLPFYDRNGGLFGHLNWHLGLFELHAGNLEAGLRLYNDAFCADDHRGAVHQKLSDSSSFLWRAELAGHPRDHARWVKLQDYAREKIPRPGFSLADWHVALAYAVDGDDAALEGCVRAIEELVKAGRYPSGSTIPT